MKRSALITRRNVAMTVVTILVVLLCIFSYQTYALFAARTELMKKAIQETEKETELLRLKKDLLLVSSDEKKLEDAFVSSDEVPRFLEKIELLAKSRDLTFSIGSLAIIDEKGRKVLRADLLAEGTYDSLLSFVRGVENLPYLVELGSFNLTQSGDTHDRWQSHSTLILKSYGSK